MATTVKLNAESKYGFSGQYIARILGRAPKVQFAREFVGSRYGKRNEGSSYETDEIGLYEKCDVDKQGKRKSYVLVLPWREGIRKLYSDSTDALMIAKRLDAGEQLTDFVRACRGEAMTQQQGYYKCNTCNREVEKSADKCAEHAEAQIVYSYRQIPKLNDQGEPLYHLVYEILKPGEAKKEKAAGSVEVAVQAIVAALQALPAADQKKALSVARAQLFPKVQTEGQNDESGKE